MKKIILSLVAIVLSLVAFTQPTDNISIGVIVPENLDGITNPAFKLLETRIRNITAKHNVSSWANGTFVVYPVINIIDNQLVEGALSRMYIYEIELSLFVAQVKTKSEYASVTTTLKGSGKTKTDAVKDAFSKININDNRYKIFIQEAKTKIINYYISNKAAILSQADVLIKHHRYQEAISLLVSYPTTISGGQEVLTKAIEVYTTYQNQEDSKIVSQAKAAYALQDYKQTVILASKIDATSPQFSNGQSLITQVEKDIKDFKAEAKALILEEIEYQRKKETQAIAHRQNLENKVVDAAVSQQEHQRNMDYKQVNLEEKRIAAARDIAVAHAQNQQPVTYNQFIK